MHSMSPKRTAYTHFLVHGSCLALLPLFFQVTWDISSFVGLDYIGSWRRAAKISSPEQSKRVLIWILLDTLTKAESRETEPCFGGALVNPDRQDSLDMSQASRKC